MSSTPRPSRIVGETAAYQLAWWSCVLSVRADAAWIGLVVTIVVFAIHLGFSTSPAAEFWSVPAAAGIGFFADNLAAWLGAIRFESAASPFLLAPLWIAAMWLAFAMLIVPCFAWLANRPLTAAVMGATSGPTAYVAGTALGIVEIPHFVRGIAVLAVLWGIAVPIAIKVVVASASTSTTRVPAVATHSGDVCE